MLNIIIIVLILIGLTIHRYLSPFWEQRQLPYPGGFTFFANVFALVYLVSFIWMFGVVAGIIISILCYFQIIYSTFLWILLLPWLLVMHNPKSSFNKPEVNPFIYGGFSLIVVILGVLTIVNFFISDYQAIWKFFNSSLWIIVISFLAILLIGNVSRVVIMSRLVKGR